MKPLKASIILAIIAVVGMSFHAEAQRKITPVEPKAATAGSTPTTNQKEDPKANLAEMRDAQGNIVFVDTITGEEWVDTTEVKTDKRMKYPLLESVTVGVNVWDPVMRLLGQNYGGLEVWGELSLHNRYKPVIEFGMASCDDTPDGMNYTFKTKMSPYFRIGMNYNMFYNNDPRYQLVVGVRYGFTPFSYEVTNIELKPGYWNDPTEISIPSQNTTAGFFEFVAGVRVGIFKNISLGWTLKYHAILHEGKTDYGKPLYIPGYGKRGGAFTGSFSISYTLPLNKPTEETVDTQ